MLPHRHFSNREPPSGAPSGPGIYFSYARSIAAQKRARATPREFLSALAVGLVAGTAIAVVYGSLGLQWRALAAFSGVLIGSVGALVLRPVFAGLSADNFQKVDGAGPKKD